jgi:hypothetical protein
LLRTVLSDCEVECICRAKHTWIILAGGGIQRGQEKSTL